MSVSVKVQKQRDAARAAKEAEMRAQRLAQDATSGTSRAQPARINIFALPPLTVSKTAYYRNDGNKHIESKGYR